MDEMRLTERKSDPNQTTWEHYWYTKDDGTLEQYKAKAVASFLAKHGYLPRLMQSMDDESLYLGPIEKVTA